MCLLYRNFAKFSTENYPSDCAQSIMPGGYASDTGTDRPDRGLKAESAPVHPEEIKQDVDLRIGKNIALKATVRTTPAGLVTAGVMVAAIVLSITALVRAIRRRDRPGEAIH